MMLFNNSKFLLSPTPEEEYHNGQDVGYFKIDIVPDGENVRICTYWGNFRKSDLKKFPNHQVLEILKKIYFALEPRQIIDVPRFREFFEDNPDYSLIHRIRSKRNYPKGIRLIMHLQLEIILKPYDFEKGELFFECRGNGFPNYLPRAKMDKVLYGLLRDLHSALVWNDAKFIPM